MAPASAGRPVKALDGAALCRNGVLAALSGSGGEECSEGGRGSARGILSGLSVAVIGGGPIGMLCCVVAKAFGADAIVLADVRRERVELARKHLNASSSESGSGLVDGDGTNGGVQDRGGPRNGGVLYWNGLLQGSGARSTCGVTTMHVDRAASVSGTY